MNKIRIVTADTMRAIDRQTIEKRGIPGIELMENAGREIAKGIKYQIIREEGKWSIAIFCGKGNNGGDGFVVGRYLHKSDYNVSIYYTGPAEKLSSDARLNLDRALKLGIPIKDIRTIAELPEDLDADFIVDAIFGTGFSGAPGGIIADLIKYIDSQGSDSYGSEVISIDCPSGLNIDTGTHEGAVVKANYTYCLGLPKFGLSYSPGRELAGSTRLTPIGIPDDIVESFCIRENLLLGNVISPLLPARKPDGHKGDFGKLFILAGSTGMTGAAALCAMASVRTGLGLATVGCPESINHILEIKLTEPMTYPLPDVAKKGVLALRGLGEIRKKISQSDAVIIGPGIGRYHETTELVQKIVSSLDKPALIDADGLNAFERNRQPLLDEHPKFILTPHPGEFRRLIDEDIPNDRTAKYDLVRKYAAKYNCVIVFKESPSFIVDTDGELFLNSTGNDGMATGGTGDVLSGMIGSFLAQGLSPLNAAVCGVYLHGLAGDMAVCETGRRSLIAGDIVEFLPDAFNNIEGFSPDAIA